MTEYVTGILFNQMRTRCVLMLKNRPHWQAGYLNAVGGHIEDAETPTQAMYREFMEETNVSIPTWEEVLDLYSQPAGHIHFFRAFYPDGVLDCCRTMTDEPIHGISVASLPVQRVIPNLRWIIPVMLAKSLSPFTVHESTPGGF